MSKGSQPGRGQPYRARCLACLADSLPASSATYGVRFCCGFSTTDAGYAGADFAFVVFTVVAVVVVLPTLPSELHALIAHTLSLGFLGQLQLQEINQKLLAKGRP